jgi:alpha-beta hydrolase superfamily lysophospholipase
MKKEKLYINKIPAILFGELSDKVYLYIHGQGGRKEEAEGFAVIAARHGRQVLSVDLPEHGERKQGQDLFNPWNAAPELRAVMGHVKKGWAHVSLFASSIGAYFSMLSFDGRQLEQCLFVSPVLNMECLISQMMLAANVSEERLQRELAVPNPYGPTLSWEYFQYAKNHPILDWPAATSILYGENDTLVARDTVEKFAHQFACELTIMRAGEHWFHTEAQLDFLYGWAEACL